MDEGRGGVVAPAYPHAANGSSGRVVVRAFVGASGQLDEIALVGPAASALFNNAAFDAVLRTSFEPAVDATGKPLRYSLDLAFTFDGAARAVRTSLDVSHPPHALPLAKYRHPTAMSAEQVSTLRKFYQDYDLATRGAPADHGLSVARLNRSKELDKMKFLSSLRGFNRLGPADVEAHARFTEAILRHPDWRYIDDVFPPVSYLLALPLIELRQYADLRLRALRADIARVPANYPSGTREEIAEAHAAAAAVLDAESLTRLREWVLAPRNPEAFIEISKIMYRAAPRIPPGQRDVLLRSLLPDTETPLKR
ncbi:energy transducer TonB [Achromobacter seleniivolatilans]|uniref:Energy transducer TonB n=1 Tax=Achromobacter seleniivolatilans TaxID=3047478 RepID=A0ABY9M1I5_9BURK|nr:energy transducer TonB [Achromobacter sp. R39]WMD20620.1 energy transducer TonB [Achromobacter sp. R39]